jgi:hypothetical protein
MKKYILFGLLGGFILFFWQFLSNAALDLHDDFHQYTEKQDTITSFINQLNLEDGSYMMPMYPSGLSQEEIQKYMEAKKGKPWIIIQYHKNWDMDMLSPMLRGFTVDILVAIMLFYILNQIQNNSARKSILIFTFIGFIGFLTISYLNFIWYETPDIYACMMDGIIPWALLGAIGFKMRIKNQSNPL